MALALALAIHLFGLGVMREAGVSHSVALALENPVKGQHSLRERKTGSTLYVTMGSTLELDLPNC